MKRREKIRGGKTPEKKSVDGGDNSLMSGTIFTQAVRVDGRRV